MTIRIHLSRLKLGVHCGKNQPYRNSCFKFNKQCEGVHCGKNQPYRNGHQEKATQKTQS